MSGLTLVSAESNPGGQMLDVVAAPFQKAVSDPRNIKGNAHGHPSARHGDVTNAEAARRAVNGLSVAPLAKPPRIILFDESPTFYG